MQGGSRRLCQPAPGPSTRPAGAAPMTSRRACPGMREGCPNELDDQADEDGHGRTHGGALRLEPDRVVLLPPSARARGRRRRGTELHRGEEGLPRRRSSRHRRIHASVRAFVPLAAALTQRRRGERRGQVGGAGREGCAAATGAGGSRPRARRIRAATRRRSSTSRGVHTSRREVARATTNVSRTPVRPSSRASS
jgi:hypothetical protein